MVFKHYRHTTVPSQTDKIGDPVTKVPPYSVVVEVKGGVCDLCVSLWARRAFGMRAGRLAARCRICVSFFHARLAGEIRRPDIADSVVDTGCTYSMTSCLATSG